MKNILLLIFFIAVTFRVTGQKFEVSKLDEKKSGSDQALIYALPQTSIIVNVEVTKTIIKRGPYAEYAEKYLKLTDVPLKDSETFAVSNIKLQAQAEADPAQYYTVTFKTFPDKLQNLFMVSENGVILDFADSWQHVNSKSFVKGSAGQPMFDPNLLEETSKEKVDTLYKTVMTDSTFVRIPVFKKQIQAKSEEEIIQETANQLIKTRRHKIKILRGEYDFHPDGPALKVMVDELSKYEETLLSLFTGTRVVERLHYSFIFVPQVNAMSKDLCYFNQEKGILNEKTMQSSVFSIHLTKETEPAKGILPDRTKNALYVRTPVMADIDVKLDDKSVFTTRIPVYQLGSVMVMPLN